MRHARNPASQCHHVREGHPLLGRIAVGIWLEGEEVEGFEHGVPECHRLDGEILRTLDGFAEEPHLRVDKQVVRQSLLDDLDAAWLSDVRSRVIPVT